jgi:antitoxin YefM
MAAITASEARKNLFRLIEQVNEDHDTVEILSRRGAAVLMSRDDYESWRETAYLMRAPANARRLLAAIDRMEQGRGQRHDLIEDDDESDPLLG